MRSVTIVPVEQTAALPAALDDEPEIGALYRSYSGAVQRWAARIGGPSLDLEDVVQEVFLIAHRKLPNFRRESSPATWLFGITERVVWHKRRKERWRRWLNGSVEEALAELPATGPSPLDIAAGKQATRMFYQALEGVSDRYRAVLVMFELDELSGQQIAELTGVRLPTVWVWLHRGRAQLVKRFNALEETSR